MKAPVCVVGTAAPGRPSLYEVVASASPRLRWRRRRRAVASRGLDGLTEGFALSAACGSASPASGIGVSAVGGSLLPRAACPIASPSLVLRRGALNRDCAHARASPQRYRTRGPNL